MTNILHEHWEVRCQYCGWLCEGVHDGESSWDVDASTPVVQAATREYARSPRDARHESGCDGRVVLVHVVRRKRGAARREALEEAAGLAKTAQAHAIKMREKMNGGEIAFGWECRAEQCARLADEIDRLAKESSHG